MFPDESSRSYALYQEAKSVLPGGNTRTTVFLKPYPIYAARGEGSRVGTFWLPPRPDDKPCLDR